MVKSDLVNKGSLRRKTSEFPDEGALEISCAPNFSRGNWSLISHRAKSRRVGFQHSCFLFTEIFGAIALFFFFSMLSRFTATSLGFRENTASSGIRNFRKFMVLRAAPATIEQLEVVRELHDNMHKYDVSFRQAPLLLTTRCSVERASRICLNRCSATGCKRKAHSSNRFRGPPSIIDGPTKHTNLANASSCNSPVHLAPAVN